MELGENPNWPGTRPYVPQNYESGEGRSTPTAEDNSQHSSSSPHATPRGDASSEGVADESAHEEGSFNGRHSERHNRSSVIQILARSHVPGDTTLALTSIMVAACVGTLVSAVYVAGLSQPRGVSDDEMAVQRDEIIISGGVLSAFFATLLALGTRIGHGTCGAAGSCRAIFCGLWTWFCGALMIVVLITRAVTRRMQTRASHSMRHFQQDIVELVVDLLVEIMMAWWWLGHFGPCEPWVPMADRPALAFTRLVLPVAITHAWLGHAWHDWLFILMWLLVGYQLGLIYSTTYQSLAEPDVEIGRLYEQQYRRRRERSKGKEKARDVLV